MGKSFWLVFILIFVVFGAYAISFYWNNLRGIGPALQNPPGDIAKLLENAKPVPQNSTGFPLKLPDGFAISVFANNLGGPRVLAFDPAGNLIVSVPSKGTIIALPDKDGDGTADSAITLLDHLAKPHGIAFKCADEKNCKLYVAEENALTSYDYDSANLKASNRQKLLDLPAGGNHVTRSLLFLPPPDDAKLLISIGSTCNVCVEKDSRRASVLVFDTATGKAKPFASGLRNSVFMTLHPLTKKIWATEMGRDLLGDDTPPDEINILEEGKNYGWPNCYGKNMHDMEFDKNVYIRNPCSEPFEMPSAIDVPAHSAPLGLAFGEKDILTNAGWPEEYWNNLFVAYHGSWNRSAPTGYKIVRYKLGANGGWSNAEIGANPPVEDFITGWLVPGKSLPLPGQAPEGALGRPVGIMFDQKGVLFVSDDKAGVIYRIMYGGARVTQ